MECSNIVINGIKNMYILKYGRTCDLIYLGFADEPFDNSENRIVALHIQCGFRIIQENRLIVCNEEMYVPRDGASQEEMDSFKWDEPNARYDEEMKRFMEGHKRKVMQAEIYEWGDIILKCDDGTKIYIYITSTDDDNEQWRFIQGSERDIIRTPYMYELADEFPDGFIL